MQKLTSSGVNLGTINSISDLSNTTNPFGKLNSVLSVGIGLITVIAAVWFIYLLITGAVSYMGSGGDKGKIEEAKQKLFTAIVGLIIVIAAIFLAELVGWLLGLDILNAGYLLRNLRP